MEEEYDVTTWCLENMKWASKGHQAPQQSIYAVHAITNYTYTVPARLLSKVVLNS